MGDDDPVAVTFPGLEVTVNDVAAGEPPGKLKLTSAAALFSNARPLPMSVADTLTGAEGCKKSFCDCDLLPALLLISNPFMRLGHQTQAKCLMLSLIV